jgi:outer membrane lipoprotein carrier protein
MMKKIILFGFLLWVESGFCDAVSDELQTKLNAIRTMKAVFSQVVKAKQHELSHSSGTMALSRPGKFRWQTKRPMEQLVIADGKKMWVYDVELEQVTVKKQETGVGGTAALFLSGYDDTLARDFDVAVHKEGNKDCFDLHSKSNKANFQRVKLVFTGPLLSGIELFDQLGQQTDVVLSEIKNNPTLSSKLFTFTVPKGVDLVEQ